MRNSKSQHDIPEELKSELAKISAQLKENFERFIPKDFNFKKNYELFQNSIIKLSENNWYPNFDMAMSQVIQAGLYIERGQLQEADIYLKEYFDQEIDELALQIIRKFPNREKVLNAAIKAHKEKQYYLSIPVFYSQAEGICQEITEIRFFKVKNGNPKTASIVDNYNGFELTLDLLQPLNLISSNRQLQNFEKPLGVNRHDIMHGQSTDYGEDEFISYKALSLLIYISDVIFDATER